MRSVTDADGLTDRTIRNMTLAGGGKHGVWACTAADIVGRL